MQKHPTALRNPTWTRGLCLNRMCAVISRMGTRITTGDAQNQIVHCLELFLSWPYAFRQFDHSVDGR